jgi:Endosomal/lysosomal potassium channel TMEM175
MLPERRYETSRLEQFSDAAFAFALTLLVVSLEVPRSYGALIALIRQFPSFACCFALLVWIWHEHNMFFRRYGLHDNWTVVINGVLIFVVLFYVYPLKFMFDSFLAQFLPAPPGFQQMTLSARGGCRAARLCAALADVLRADGAGALVVRQPIREKEEGLRPCHATPKSSVNGRFCVTSNRRSG